VPFDWTKPQAHIDALLPHLSKESHGRRSDVMRALLLMTLEERRRIRSSSWRTIARSADACVTR
jgi:hypothetical protein